MVVREGWVGVPVYIAAIIPRPAIPFIPHISAYHIAMASVARILFRSTARSAARPQLLASPIRQGARRGYSNAAGSSSGGSSAGLFAGLAAATAAAAGGGYYLYSNGQLGLLNNKLATPTILKPTKEDFQKVYNDIAELLEDNDYDDGSFGPVCPPLLTPSPPFHPRTGANGDER